MRQRAGSFRSAQEITSLSHDPFRVSINKVREDGRMISMSGDAAEVAPEVARVLFENDRVRVLELKFKRRQKMAMHTHPANVGYALTSGRMKVTLPDGRSQVVKNKKGQVVWSDGSTHTVENLENKTAIILHFELKK